MVRTPTGGEDGALKVNRIWTPGSSMNEVCMLSCVLKALLVSRRKCSPSQRGYWYVVFKSKSRCPMIFKRIQCVYFYTSTFTFGSGKSSQTWLNKFFFNQGQGFSYWSCFTIPVPNSGAFHMVMEDSDRFLKGFLSFRYWLELLGNFCKLRIQTC